MYITLEAICASQHPEAAFIMPLHPLVRQAARAFDIRKRVVTALKVKEGAIPDGKYQYVIYQWQFYGIREDLVLCPVASSELVTSNLNKLLEKAEEDPTRKENVTDLSAWDSLDAHHYKLWSDARDRHQRRTHELARYRRESLATSHRARISLLEEQLNQASDDKIKRMRQSQIASAEADYARRIQDLDIAMERAEITARPVAYGVIHVDGGNTDA